MQSHDPLPQEFTNRLHLLYQDNKEEVLKTFSEEKPITFRINTLKSSRQEMFNVFANHTLHIEPVSWYDTAFIFRGPKSSLTTLPEYRQGKFYIQNLSSMIPALALEPTQGNSVLDIAAAPGSKTTQLAVMMGGEGELVANDISRARIFKLKDNLSQQGITTIKILNLPGERLWRKYPEYFDRVLVDAPCSMEGRITTSDPDSYKDWSVKKIKELSHRQQYLLRSAITATKVGGIIVYSTCTLAPEENEGVIDWILEKEGDAVSLEKN